MLLKWIKEIVERVFNASTFLKLRSHSSRRRVYRLLTAQYLNYGDHAIAWAEEQFLKKYFPGLDVVEISFSFYEFWPEKFEKAVKPGDVLLITGGGFMGDLWPHSQALINRIVRVFPHNKTVIFPQTIYFSSVGVDNKIFQQTREIFLQHEDLWLFVREENSLRMATELFLPELADRCFLVPDIVISLPEQRFPVKRKGALLVLRSDHERVIPLEAEKQITAFLEERQVPCRRALMMISHMEIPVALRKWFLKPKLRQYAKVRLVVTDRLHGMLFAYVTRTPCLVFDNVSKKVSGVHRWIEYCPWVQIAGENWQGQLDELLGQPLAQCKGREMEAHFAPLRRVLEKILQEVPNGQKKGR